MTTVWRLLKRVEASARALALDFHAARGHKRGCEWPWSIWDLIELDWSTIYQSEGNVCLNSDNRSITYRMMTKWSTGILVLRLTAGERFAQNLTCAWGLHMQSIRYLDFCLPRALPGTTDMVFMLSLKLWSVVYRSRRSHGLETGWLWGESKERRVRVFTKEAIT